MTAHIGTWPLAPPVDDALATLAITAGDLESATDELAWFAQIARPGSMTRLALAADIRAVVAEVTRLRSELAIKAEQLPRPAIYTGPHTNIPQDSAWQPRDPCAPSADWP